MSETSHGSSNPESDKSLESRMVDCLLLDADWVVTCDRSMRCVRNGSVAMDGSTIAAVGPADDIRSRFQGKRELDMRGHLVAPGLVNTHTHAAMACFRGLGSDLPLDKWLREVIFPAEAASVNPHLVYYGTLLASVEMLLNGITTFCDGYFFEESAAKAVLEVGIRAVLGQGLLDFPTPDMPDPAGLRDRAEIFLDAFPKSDRLRPSLFCHAPYTCGPLTLQWVKNLCRERGILFQTHVSETASEAESLTREHGLRPFFYLDRLGILDADTLCIHAIWTEPDEIELIASRGVGVSHNAESGMKLASGVAALTVMLDRGVNVGLGTDGCASNDDLDLFMEMGSVARLHKVLTGNPVVCPASRVLEMATRGGARILGWLDEAGSIEAGKKADLVSINLNQPHLTPLYDPISHLVYTVKGSDVCNVWVDGRQVVENGRVLTVDVEEVIAEVRSIAEGIKSSCRP